MIRTLIIYVVLQSFNIKIMSRILFSLVRNCSVKGLFTRSLQVQQIPMMRSVSLEVESMQLPPLWCQSIQYNPLTTHEMMMKKKKLAKRKRHRRRNGSQNNARYR
jgi:hypothetical protein